MGLARSGKAAIESLALGGARVLAWDDDPKMREEISGVGVFAAAPPRAICAIFSDSVNLDTRSATRTL